jgi:hypothetical protein
VVPVVSSAGYTCVLGGGLCRKLMEKSSAIIKVPPLMAVYDVPAVTALNSVSSSVADPDPGSGAFLPPGSGIRDPDPGWSCQNIVFLLLQHMKTYVF